VSLVVATISKPVIATGRRQNMLLKSLMKLVVRLQMNTSFYSKTDVTMRPTSESAQKLHYRSLDSPLTMEEFRDAMQNGKVILGDRHEQATH